MLGDGNTQPAVGWLRPARFFSVGMVAASLAVFLAGLPARWQELSRACAAEHCPILSLQAADVVVLDAVGLSLSHYAFFQIGLELLAALLYLTPVALLLWRRGDAWMVLLAAPAFIGLGVNLMTESSSALARVYPVTGYLVAFLQALSVQLFAWLLFTFPNGRLVPRWAWALTLPLLGLMAFNVAFRPTVENENPLRIVVVASLLGAFVSGVAAQVFRYRFRSTQFERQQTKWVLAGLAGMAANIIVWTLAVEIFLPPPGPGRLAVYMLAVGVTAALFSTLPISLTFAILRYRLWDIDLLIRRTLIYAVLTATLALVYFGAVISLQALLRLITDQEQSEIVVVLSTLLIAALFVPVRRRWQEAIDRRFYRRRYDAAQVLEAFGAGLRDEVELEPLTRRLVTTVEETMQPEAVSLWLNDAPADMPPSR